MIILKSNRNFMTIRSVVFLQFANEWLKIVIFLRDLSFQVQNNNQCLPQVGGYFGDE